MNPYLALVLVVAACFTPNLATDLATLSDAQLLEEYERRGVGCAAMTGPCHEVARFLGDPEGDYWREIREEILRRGSKMVPVLLSVLEREIGSTGDLKDYTEDICRLLIELRDPSAVPILIEILDDYDGKADEWQIDAVSNALHALTYLRVGQLRYISFPDGRPPAVVVDFEGSPAEFYREWLRMEGRYPEMWLPLARARAVQAMASDDVDRVFNAATFLFDPLNQIGSRVEDPEPLLDRLDRILYDLRNWDGWSCRGNSVHDPIEDWLRLVSVHGPQAREHVPALLHIVRTSRFTTGWEDLVKIGGERAMRFLVLRALAAAPPEDHEAIRQAIDRWAGRLFSSDAERRAWYEVNRSKTQETWLTEGLPIAAAQVDAGEPPWLLQLLLPDWGAVQPVPPARRWLAKHREQLRYDPDRGAFVLDISR